jgi:hypothetical protein
VCRPFLKQSLNPQPSTLNPAYLLTILCPREYEFPQIDIETVAGTLPRVRVRLAFEKVLEGAPRHMLAYEAQASVVAEACP